MLPHTFCLQMRRPKRRASPISQAVATMRTGERAVVYVPVCTLCSATIRLWLRLARATLQDPKYGYGEQGSFSFPAVPPHERLTYEVECVDFEAPDEEDVSGARPPACVGL